jgi:hypothetical protein
MYELVVPISLTNECLFFDVDSDSGHCPKRENNSGNGQ